jgi:UrcA family protein
MFNTHSRSVAATLGRLTLAVVFSAACLGAAVMPASAATTDSDTTTQTLVVSTGGLDLSQSRDQATLMRRLQLASQRVCHDPASNSFENTPGFEECVRSAMRAARVGAHVAIASATRNSKVASAEQ